MWTDQIKTHACTLHWLDGVVGAAGFPSEASSSSTVVAHRTASTKTVAAIHAIVTAIMVTIHKSISAAIIPSSRRIFEQERDVILSR